MESSRKPFAPAVRIVASGAGGGNDAVARLLARGLAQELKQPVVVENVVGKYAAAKRVAESPPDGNTLLLYGSGLWFAPLLNDHVPYDVVRDFSPVTLAARSPNVVLVHQSVTADSVAELIASVREGKDKIKCGYSVPGGSPHLAAELFRSMAGVPIATVACASVAALFADLHAGKLQMAIPNAAAAQRHLDSGSLKALAVTSATPSAQFPLLPTVESTLAGYVSEAVFSLLAPAGTHADTIMKFHRAIARLLARAEVQQQLLAIGLEVVAGTPEQLAATIKQDIHRMAPVFAGIRRQ